MAPGKQYVFGSFSLLNVCMFCETFLGLGVAVADLMSTEEFGLVIIHTGVRQSISTVVSALNE